MSKFDSDLNNKKTVIDQFIDDLNEEKRPAAYQAGPVDPEMEKLFETVRAVRRLEQGSRSREKAYRRPRVKGWLAVAAVLLLVVLGLSILQFPGLDLALPGVKRGGIVEASAIAYEELHSYSGIFEIRSERDGTVDSLETITIQYQKPNKYVAVHRVNALEQRYVSDGEKMIADEYGRVTIENLFPEKELWRYHIGTVIHELGVNLINYQLQRIDFLHSLEVFSFCRGKKKQKPLVAASTLYFTLGRFVHLAAFHCAWPRCCFRRPRLFLTFFHARYRRDFGPLIIALGIVLFSAVKKAANALTLPTGAPSASGGYRGRRRQGCSSFHTRPSGC